MQLIRVRIKATGQIQEMIPNVARAMIVGGTAVEVDENGRDKNAVETASFVPALKAVAPAQTPVKKARK